MYESGVYQELLGPTWSVGPICVWLVWSCRLISRIQNVLPNLCKIDCARSRTEIPVIFCTHISWVFPECSVKFGPNCLRFCEMAAILIRKNHIFRSHIIRSHMKCLLILKLPLAVFATPLASQPLDGIHSYFTRTCFGWVCSAVHGLRLIGWEVVKWREI